MTTSSTTTVYVATFDGLIVGSGPSFEAAHEAAAANGAEAEDEVIVGRADSAVAAMVSAGQDPGELVWTDGVFSGAEL